MPLDRRDERSIGKKFQATDIDLKRYSNDLVKILKLSDGVKRARKDLHAAQVNYEEACSSLAKEKQCFDDIFSQLGSDDHMTISKD